MRKGQPKFRLLMFAAAVAGLLVCIAAAKALLHKEAGQTDATGQHTSLYMPEKTAWPQGHEFYMCASASRRAYITPADRKCSPSLCIDGKASRVMLWNRNIVCDNTPEKD